MAAAIAHCFHIDPLAVLNSTHKEFAVRLAAFNYIEELQRKAKAEADAKSKAAKNK